MRLFMINFAYLSVLFLTSCSAQTLYRTGQAWQRNECNKSLDEKERAHCAASTSATYEEYKRQAEAAKGVQ